MLPGPLTHLSGFASLNKDYLKPHDTIHAVVKSGDRFHGIVELTWAFPTPTRPQADAFVITGSNGWISVNQVSKPGSAPVLQILVKSVHKPDGKPEVEKEEIIEVPSKGVAAELTSFFDKVAGKADVLEIGEPLGALEDVAFIQAALNSNGELVDLVKLVQS